MRWWLWSLAIVQLSGITPALPGSQLEDRDGCPSPCLISRCQARLAVMNGGRLQVTAAGHSSWAYFDSILRQANGQLHVRNAGSADATYLGTAASGCAPCQAHAAQHLSPAYRGLYSSMDVTSLLGSCRTSACACKPFISGREGGCVCQALAQ